MVDQFDDWDEISLWRKCWASFFWVGLMVVGLVIGLFSLLLRTTPNRSGGRQWQ